MATERLRRSPLCIGTLAGVPLLLPLLLAAGLPASSSTFLQFPPDFVFGLVMDAYQFEGNVTSDGAGVSNLHMWCEWNLGQPDNGGWQLCGDVGAGFYSHWREDVALLAALGQKHLHFQIAWTRIFPQCPRGSVLQRPH